MPFSFILVVNRDVVAKDSSSVGHYTKRTAFFQESAALVRDRRAILTIWRDFEADA